MFTRSHQPTRRFYHLCHVLVFVFVLITSLLWGSVPATAQEPQPPIPTVAPRPTPPTPHVEPFPTHRTTLPNGLRVWSQPRESSDSVAVMLLVHTGARDETRENSGIAHFVEHMLFTGTEQWDEETLKDIISSRGGSWNGSTSTEETRYFAQVAANDLDIALEWLSQVVFHPTFPAEKVPNERHIIFQEKGGRYDWIFNLIDTMGVGYNLEQSLQEALYGTSSLNRPTIGTDESLERINRTMLLDYYQTYYVPSNAVLVVVGKLNPEQVATLAHKHFGSVAAGEPPPPREPAPDTVTPPQTITLRVPTESDQVSLLLGARTVGKDHPDYWPLEVLSWLLYKELIEEVRYRRGLVYSIRVGNVTYQDTGYFVVSTRTDKDNQEQIHATIADALDRIQQGDIDPDRLERVKAALKGRWTLHVEDNLERADWMAEWAVLLDEDEPLPNFRMEVDAVTPDDLARVTATYLDKPHRYVGVHHPIITMASGAWLVGGLLLLLVVVRLVRRARRRRANQHDQQAVPL